VASDFTDFVILKSERKFYSATYCYRWKRHARQDQTSNTYQHIGWSVQFNDNDVKDAKFRAWVSVMLAVSASWSQASGDYDGYTSFHLEMMADDYLFGHVWFLIHLNSKSQPIAKQKRYLRGIINGQDKCKPTFKGQWKGFCERTAQNSCKKRGPWDLSACLRLEAPSRSIIFSVFYLL